MDHWYRGYEIQIERIGSTFFAFVWRPGAKIEWGPPTVTSTDVEGTSFLLARACDRIDEELRERPGRRDVQMTPAQCRAARALIGMTQVELAGHAVVPVSVIADFEAGTNLPRQSNVDALQKALETAGVEFIGGDRPGVRSEKAK